MTGRIYILRAGPFAKIGWAKNDVTGRAKLLQTGCPFPISVAREIPGSRRQEAALHRLFSDMRAHGEWFHWSDAMMTVEPPEVQPVQAPATDAGDGNALAQWMRRNRYTVNDVAEACGVGKSSVYRWLSGTGPHRRVMAKLATLTSGAVSADDFVPQTEPAA